MLKVECPTCKKTIKAQDDWAGKIGKCPGCGGRVGFGNLPPAPPPFAGVAAPASSGITRGRPVAFAIVAIASWMIGVVSASIVLLMLWRGNEPIAPKAIKAAPSQPSAEEVHEHELERYLSHIEISDAEYHSSDFSAWITLTLKNHSPRTITAFKVHCQLSSPKREHPWSEGDIAAIIPGGLERKESRDVEIRPEIGSSFATPVKEPKAELEITLVDAQFAE